MYVLTHRPLAAPDDGAVGHGHVEVVVREASAWQGLVGDLVRRCTRSPAPELLAAQHLVMEWARGDRPRFEWAVRGTGRPGRASPPAAGRAAPRATSQALADDVLAVLLGRITSGHLAGGDRVTESFLARSVHASRGNVRDALRSASSGLVDLEPHRGAVIPTPHVADVVETYAARRALGAPIVRHALGPGALTPVERAGGPYRDRPHGQRLGDRRSRPALPGPSRGVPRCTASRRCSTSSPHSCGVFIAVMGLDYTYSIPGMCQDDTTLLDCIRARDEAGAARA
jgi:hypothetical protein